MKLAAAIYLGLKVFAWTSTFIILSLLLEVNSAGDRAIQTAVGRASWITRQAIEFLITTLLDLSKA
jgi:hypothetical protein